MTDHNEHRQMANTTTEKYVCLLSDVGPACSLYNQLRPKAVSAKKPGIVPDQKAADNP